MGLVSYSDSEGSDDESQIQPKASLPAPTAAKPAFQRTQPRKIAVSLPTINPEPSASKDAQPPAKRARTGGNFGGFNSLLPAPKRPAAASKSAGLGRGVNLRTSGEAAFSRNPAPVYVESYEDDAQEDTGASKPEAEDAAVETKAPEVKIVGQATRFRPLSVANNRKKKVVKKTAISAEETKMESKDGKGDTGSTPVAAAPPPEKKKRSLFSVPQTDSLPEEDTPGGEYVSLAAQEQGPIPTDSTQQSVTKTLPSHGGPSDSLSSVANDLNLTAAERRQLFGRHGGNKDIAFTHFRTDAEYAANEAVRQAGDAFEHRAVKSIAPGKHSLQQLVNNARQNEEAIEDKWAEGRAKRGK